jgi:alcohol dehydrogenase class IV
MLGQFGYRRVLIVTDAVLMRLGLITPLKETLEAQGMSVAVFDGIEPDPTHTVIAAGGAALKAHRSDAVLAVGGGSSIDAAKVIAAMGTNDKPPGDFAGFFRVWHLPVPLFAIPTTAGTGSEVTVAAVISDPETHSKSPVLDPKIVPMGAALDPVLMRGMPRPITAATGMDALTHAVEAYTNRWGRAETDAYATAAVRMVFQNLPRAYAEGHDLDARQGMALASFYAGLAFTKAYVGYVHAFSHALGGRYGTPHGLGNAIVLPWVLDFIQEAARDRLAELAVVIGAGNAGEAQEALAARFIVRVRELNQLMSIPDKVAELKAADIPSIARAALIEATRDYPVPRVMSVAQAEDLLRKLLVS